MSPTDDDVAEEDNYKGNSENAERTMMKDKEVLLYNLADFYIFTFTK